MLCTTAALSLSLHPTPSCAVFGRRKLTAPLFRHLFQIHAKAMGGGQSVVTASTEAPVHYPKTNWSGKVVKGGFSAGPRTMVSENSP